MIRAVVDTNVLFSGIRTPRGNEARVLATVRMGLTQVCVSPSILLEYEEVLRRPKFGFPLADVAALLAMLRSLGDLIEPLELPQTGPDPSDFMFMRCAVAAKADYLITGNRKHFPAPFYGTARVVNARTFLESIPVDR